MGFHRFISESRASAKQRVSLVNCLRFTQKFAKNMSMCTERVPLCTRSGRFQNGRSVLNWSYEKASLSPVSAAPQSIC